MLDEILSAIEDERELYLRIYRGENKCVKCKCCPSYYIGNSQGSYNDHYTSKYLEWHELEKRHKVLFRTALVAYSAYFWLAKPKEQLQVLRCLNGLETGELIFKGG